MIYKRYELSRSLNGENVIHIARNSSGNVVFRENSEAELIDAIDKYLDDKAREEAAEQKRREEKAKAKAKSKERALFAPIVEEDPEEQVTEDEEEEEEAEVLVPPQSRITRGPDGKFISKSALEAQNTEQKKSFWDRLK